MRADSIRRAALAAALAASASPTRADPSAEFRAMVERPLFSPSRRPPPPPLAALPPPVLPEPAPSAPDLTLSGVIAGGGGGVALVRRPQDGAPVRVALGGQIDGWTLSEIRPRTVVLRRDDRSVTLDLPTPAR
ncbi:hypothetical protein [Lichenibacterium dinghuense]|uniref:hypothetical protein n=1 Tax=Lichenibacterium dinghuense TaxID=2895977 RepID=UPI001F4390A6|nr:hypothetical protein [Lichenibacterium sp. 6Y81]